MYDECRWFRAIPCGSGGTISDLNMRASRLFLHHDSLPTNFIETFFNIPERNKKLMYLIVFVSWSFQKYSVSFEDSGGSQRVRT